MTRVDLAYMAGFFDGEGSVSLYIKGKRYELQVCLSNTNEWVVRLFQFNFGGGVYLDKRNEKNPNHRDAWRWQLRAKKAVKFLNVLHPYLILKKPQSALATSFQARRKLGRTVPPGLRVQDEADRILMRSYNKGVKANDRAE